MFEKFSDRARKVITLARNEAKSFNHEAIGTEHLLLAILKNGENVACTVLRNLDVDYCQARAFIEKLVQPGPPYLSTSQAPYTPRLKNVFTLACDEAGRLGHNYVGTEHLLLGLFREKEGVAHAVLKKFDLDFTMLVKEVSDILSLEEIALPKNEATSKDKALRDLIVKLLANSVQQSTLIQEMLAVISKE